MCPGRPPRSGRGITPRAVVWNVSNAAESDLRAVAVHLVGAAEISSLLGVAAEEVNAWKDRHAEFPTPVSCLRSGDIWDRREVITWARATGRLSAELETTDEAVDRLFAALSAAPLPEPTVEQRVASRARAERLRRIQAQGQKDIVANRGRLPTPEERDEILRQVMGKD